MARRIRDPFEYVDDADGAPRFTSRPVVRPQQSESREPVVIWSTQPEDGAGTRQEQTQSMNPHAAILRMNLAGPSRIHSAAAAANEAVADEMAHRRRLAREQATIDARLQSQQANIDAQNRIANLSALQGLLAQEERDKADGKIRIGPPTPRQQLIGALLRKV